MDKYIKKQLDKYAQAVLEENELLNLVSIKDLSEFWSMHIMDCLALEPYIPQGAKVIDVGSGAGMPAVVLKIARPDIFVMPLDSIRKKMDALMRIALKTGADIGEYIVMRAEVAAHIDEYRESFDVAVARALAPLPQALEYCAAFVKAGGVFIAMKGKALESELQLAQGAAELLGLEGPNIKSYSLEGDIERKLAIYTKTAQTPGKYPRRQAAIKKKPLP
ncbi:MAG: 16S rRNA (guanine(527)-N(7))-methyltransferase RsmG [Eubacteriaceae bacterium]|nr:16S rRNA (guanine(527)-N(7))-methyltransferase RsmG [Eubacteriaceae bacterium]